MGILRCVLEQDTLLSQCLSPPGVQMGSDEVKVGINPAMEENPIQG